MHFIYFINDNNQTYLLLLILYFYIYELILHSSTRSTLILQKEETECCINRSTDVWILITFCAASSWQKLCPYNISYVYYSFAWTSESLQSIYYLGLTVWNINN